VPAKYAKGREKKEELLPANNANDANGNQFFISLIGVIRGQNSFVFFRVLSRISRAIFLLSRENSSATFTKADASEAFAFAEAFHDDLVAVFEKAPLFAGWQFERLGSAPC
jgi:hypothetical protein